MMMGLVQIPKQLGPNRRRSPHIGKHTGTCIDYNGVGIWSVEEIQQRYGKHADAIGVVPVQLVPKCHTEGGRTWVYPLMDQIISLIDAGDKAAIEIGIEFIEEDDFFAFGRILRSNSARALRRVPLTPEQEGRIRVRLVRMMLSGQVPHEWHEYKRLLKRIGLGSMWPMLDEGVDRENKYVMKYYDYLDRYARSN